MIDDRFSAATFEARGLDTAEAAELAAKLADVVAGIVHDAIRPVVAKVTLDLNGLGHSLKESGPHETGHIDYRDEWTDAEGYHARLRLAVDIVVSTGYAHNLTTQQLLAETEDLNNHDD